MKAAFSDYNADYILTGFNEVAQLKKEMEKEKEEMRILEKNFKLPKKNL